MVKVNNDIDKTKGENDDKQYRFLQLENNLEILLISTRFCKQTEQDTNMHSIINDRRMSVRHSKVALVKTNGAKDLLLGEQSDVVLPLESEKEEFIKKRPPSLPKRIRSSVNLQRRNDIMPNAQRLSHRSRRRTSVTVNTSHINRISLFSELKPIVRIPRQSFGVDEELDILPGPVSMSTRKSKRKTFLRSTSTVPGNLMINVDNPVAQDQGRIKMAVVSMAVAVGSFAEPDEYHGLAHFLEHMLFMGSKAFDGENQFDEFLARVGGSSNAYTDAERSVYHFNCPQDHLRQALEMFAHFFIDPLLLPECGRRELQSIQEEFNLRKNDDECLSLELWRESSRRGTPFSRFTCGNKDTLSSSENDVAIFEKLREFHERYYVADNMKLVIQTGLDLDELQEMSCEIFSEIPPLKPELTPYPKFSHIGLPWYIGIPSVSKRLEQTNRIWSELLKNDLNHGDQGITHPGENGASLGCVFCTVPLQDGHKLTMLWQLPPQCTKKSCRPTDYLVAVLGNNCKGSIFDAARNRGWITNLTATCSTTDGFEDNSVCSLFKITIILTAQGFDQWTFVAGFVFEYLNMLKREPLRKDLFDEIVQVYRSSYNFAEETDAQARVQELSVCLLPQWGYRPHNVLDMGLHNELKWDPEEILFVLDQLRPELVRIDLGSTFFKQSKKFTGPGGTTSSRKFGKKQSAHSLVSSNRLAINMSYIKDRITGKSSRHKAQFDAENEYLTPLTEPFKRRAEMEPYTRLQYWVERVPEQVMCMWVELLEGEMSVLVSNPREGQDESSIFSFTYPPRNDYVANDFRQRSYLKNFSNTNEYKFLKEKVIQVRHGAATLPSPSLTRGAALADTFFTAKIKYIDIERQAIIVEYENGLRRWHYLPSDFFPQFQDEIEASAKKRTQSKISQMSMTDVRVSGKHNSAHALKLDSHFVAKLYNSRFKDLFAPTNLERVDTDLNSSINWKRQSYMFNFPVFDEKARNMVPILLSNSNSLLSVWHFQDPSYSYPRGEIRCRIISDLPMKSPLNAALNDFLNLVVSEAIRPVLYLAQLAEVEVLMKPFEHGQSITIYGFSHKLPQVLKAVISSFIDFAQCGSELSAFQAELEALGKTRYGRRYKTSEERMKAKKKQTEIRLFDLIGRAVFLAQLEALEQAYCNEGAQFQSTGVSTAMYRVLVQNTISPEAKAFAVRRIEEEHTLLSVFACNFLKRCKFEILVAGNISVDEANALSRSLRELLKLSNSTWLRAWEVPKYAVIPIPRAKVIPSSDEWCALSGLVHPLEALEFKGHSVDLFFEAGPNTLKSRVVLELIEHLMKEPLYNEVRTQRQLGYMVKCSAVRLYGRLGFVLELTSGKYFPHKLGIELDNFLILFRSIIRDMTPQDFFDNVAALARKKLELKSFSQAVDQHWETIEQSYEFKTLQYKWNFLFNEVEYLRDRVTREIVLRYFDQWLMPTSLQRRRVSVIVFGRDHGMNPLKEITMRKEFIEIVNGSDHQDISQSGNSPMCSIM